MRWCLSSICFQLPNQERQDEKWQSCRHKYYFLLSHLRMRIRLLHINNRIVRPPLRVPIRLSIALSFTCLGEKKNMMTTTMRMMMRTATISLR